ncbi:MAG: TolC family protein, partial [Candidatus Aminicenantes bacterium]
QQEEKTLSLSLEDCIVKAMKNNLGVAIEVLNPELSDIAITQSKEIFLPALSLSYNTRDTVQASFSFLESESEVASLRNSWSTEISQLIPTGGNFSISLDGYKNETNQSFQTINPRYGSTLTFSFSQPLLRNFGIKTTRRNIIIARNNLEISETQLKRSLQQTVYDVEFAYWALVGYIENLKVRQLSLKLAQDLLEKNKRSVEIGTIAPIEILSAQSAVASREADIIEAETQVKDSEDSLRILLNLGAEGIEEDLKIIPTDTPNYERYEVTFEEALQTAMENRPDLNGTRIGLKNREINLKYAKNQLLPTLNLTASYWSPGISGTQIIFDPTNPFAPPIGSVEHGPGEALADAFGFTYQNWTLGFTLDIPLDTVFSRANYAQARVNLEQSQLMLEDQEQQIYLEVKSAVRAVQANYERVQAYKAARELAEETLAAEEEKLRVGISTPYFVLQYQTELTTAQTNELRAIVDYNISLSGLERAIGMSLEMKYMYFSEFTEK